MTTPNQTTRPALSVSGFRPNMADASPARSRNVHRDLFPLEGQDETPHNSLTHKATLVCFDGEPANRVCQRGSRR